MLSLDSKLTGGGTSLSFSTELYNQGITNYKVTSIILQSVKRYVHRKYFYCDGKKLVFKNLYILDGEQKQTIRFLKHLRRKIFIPNEEVRSPPFPISKN